MGITEVNSDSFGLMFELGEIGTFIIPINPNNEYYENHTKDVSIIRTSKYSPVVKLVNYFIDIENEKTLYIDSLSSELSETYGTANSEELFNIVSEDRMLFNTLTRDLLEKYKKYTH